MTYVLITGITGSLGKKLVEHFLTKGYKVRGLSRCEDKQATLSQVYPELELILGDVRNYTDCLKAVKGMDVVIHTAALKRIELGEKFPQQFIKTNLDGTQNIVCACQTYKTKKMVLISTDKAVEPINVYGMTKALAEKIVTHAGYNCVRYGNVNNSRGSVIPLWKKQVAEGKPITITNPNMTRFMIDFVRAIDMIEVALKEPMDGRIIVPKLDAVKVDDLSRSFDTKKVFLGERAGEKLHEVLINEDEFRNRVLDEFDYYIILKDPIFKGHTGRYSSDKAKHLKGKELKKLL